MGVAVSSAAECILVPSSAAKVLVAAWLLRIAAEGSNSASFAAESAGSFGSAERSETFAAAAGNSFVAAASTVVGVTDVPVDLVVDAEDVLAGFVLVDLVIGQCAHYLQMWFLLAPGRTVQLLAVRLMARLLAARQAVQ